MRRHYVSEMISVEKTKAVLKAGGEFATSLTAPLYWIVRQEDGKIRAQNGSAFFLDAGDGPFAVTANHVVEYWRKDRATGNASACMIGRDLPIEFDDRLIDSHGKLDIATFRISADEVASIDKTILTGHQSIWPPAPPRLGEGICFSGFPCMATAWPSPNEIRLAATPCNGRAHSINEMDVSCLFESRDLDDLRAGPAPENYNFSGMSGGPMLTVVGHKGLRSWRLAGVIRVGPNTSGDPSQSIAGMEIFKARRAHFILPDGTLDIPRWNSLNLR